MSHHPAPHRARPFADRSSHVLGVYRDQWWETVEGLDSLLFRLRVAIFPGPWERAGPWRAVGLCPVRRYEAPAAEVDGRIHLFGGFTGLDCQALERTEIFDPADGGWSAGTSLPEPITHNVIARDGDDLWLVGGFLGDHPGPASHRTWILDTRDGAWRPGPALPCPTASGALVRVGRNLHFFGGFLDRDASTGRHLCLDLDEARTSGAARWREAAPMPEPRGHHAGIAVGRGDDIDILAVGGQLRHDTNPMDLACVHAYRVNEDRWRPVQSLPRPRSHFEVAALTVPGDNGPRAVICGGLDRSRRFLRIRGLRNVTTYDGDQDRWRELPPLPAGLGSAAAVVVGDQLYVLCGLDLLRRDGAQRVVLAAGLDDLGLT